MMRLFLSVLLITLTPILLVAQVTMDEILLKDVQEESPTVRSRAIAVLREIVENAGTKNGNLINRSVKALGDTDDTGIIPVLWRRYEECKDSEGKVLAIEAVGKLGDREQIGKLRDVFEGTDKFTARRDLMHMPPSVAAGAALLTLKDRSGILVMNSYLQGRDRQLQKRAAQAFAHTGEDSSVHLLVELLQEDDALVKEAVIEALVEVSKFGDPYVIASLKPLLDDSNKRIRIYAARTLGMLGDKSDSEILEEELKKNRYQPDLLKILYDLGDKEKAAELIKLLPEELRDRERERVEDILIELSDKSTVGPLIELLKGDDKEAVISAAGILAGLKAEEAIPTLISILKHDDEKIHEIAVSTLGLIGSEKAIPALRETMDELREADPFETRKISLREKVAIALGNIGDETGMKYFCRKRRKRNKEYTDVNGIGLAKIKNRAVVPEMINAIKNPDVEMTSGSFMAIAEALENFKAVEALPIFIDMLREHRTNKEFPIMTREESIAVIRFVGVMGKSQNIDEIEYCLNDEDLRIRLEAAIAVLKLVQAEEVAADE